MRFRTRELATHVTQWSLGSKGEGMSLHNVFPLLVPPAII
jgi:hypothetical protein